MLGAKILLRTDCRKYENFYRISLLLEWPKYEFIGSSLQEHPHVSPAGAAIVRGPGWRVLHVRETGVSARTGSEMAPWRVMQLHLLPVAPDLACRGELLVMSELHINSPISLTRCLVSSRKLQWSANQSISTTHSRLIKNELTIRVSLHQIICNQVTVLVQ